MSSSEIKISKYDKALGIALLFIVINFVVRKLRMIPELYKDSYKNIENNILRSIFYELDNKKTNWNTIYSLLNALLVSFLFILLLLSNIYKRSKFIYVVTSLYLLFIILDFYTNFQNILSSYILYRSEFKNKIENTYLIKDILGVGKYAKEGNNFIVAQLVLNSFIALLFVTLLVVKLVNDKYL